jgi:hypothetical protein
MKRVLSSFTVLLFFINCSGQVLVSNRELIEKANNELKDAITIFSSCTVKSNTKTCIDNITANANNEYKKYLIGGLLYEIDTSQSYQFHKEAYESNPLEQNFILEYAIELHRKRQYTEAAQLYESYSANVKDDIRVFVWLADCYLNTGDLKKSIENWNKTNHAKNHTSIDFAIHTIYGNTDQFKKRNDYKLEIEKGKLSSFYPLIFLDQNWQFDWWNTGTQQYFLAEDIQLAKIKLGTKSKDFKNLQTYVAVKKLEKQPKNANAIKQLLVANNLIINKKTLPEFGSITSDLLRICFISGLLSEKDFYISRGLELLNLAKKNRDKEILNIYAYLQAASNGNVPAETDLLGWNEFKDERFAISYFVGKAALNKYDDKELTQALSDFPHSSKLYWIKTNCAKIENKELKPHLIELIKREFKTLGSDENHFSYPLNAYFEYLANEK